MKSPFPKHIQIMTGSSRYFVPLGSFALPWQPVLSNFCAVEAIYISMLALDWIQATSMLVLSTG